MQCFNLLNKNEEGDNVCEARAQLAEPATHGRFLATQSVKTCIHACPHPFDICMHDSHPLTPLPHPHMHPCLHAVRAFTHLPHTHTRMSGHSPPHPSMPDTVHVRAVPILLCVNLWPSPTQHVYACMTFSPTHPPTPRTCACIAGPHPPHARMHAPAYSPPQPPRPPPGHRRLSTAAAQPWVQAPEPAGRQAGRRVTKQVSQLVCS